MKTLIIKLGATGDVLRTTTLLHVLKGNICWLTADKNIELLDTLPEIDRYIPWSSRQAISDEYFDLVVNLEDSIEAAMMVDQIRYSRLFGAYLNGSERVVYTESAAEWFDLSIISRFGKKEADALKFKNRRTYQEHIFNGMGYRFSGEEYLLPSTDPTDLKGCIAIAPKSGSVWPNKNWAYFDELSHMLKVAGYKVNYLPNRGTLKEHIADIRNHKYLISGDSLPMHIALGSGIKCLTIFICTSPWEIYDYGLQRKVVSQKLKKYFYDRSYDPEAKASIPLDEIYNEVIKHLSE